MRIFRIEGRAKDVFDIIVNIGQRNPHMTIEEAGRAGLFVPKLQDTIPYELEKLPGVSLGNGIENN
jgi:hypothetical protein